jgi:hypothetical protein
MDMESFLSEYKHTERQKGSLGPPIMRSLCALPSVNLESRRPPARCLVPHLFLAPKSVSPILWMPAVLCYFRYNALTTLHDFFETPGCWVNWNFEVCDEFFNRRLIFCSKTFCYWLCTFYPRRILLPSLHLLENGKKVEYTYTNFPIALCVFAYFIGWDLYLLRYNYFLRTLSHYRYHGE